MKKRMLKNLLLVVVMAVLCFAVGVMASAQERTIVDSGECGAEGDNVIWTFYDDGELVISGEGKMRDYAEAYDRGYYIKYTEWRNFEIQKLIIEDGITHIGSAAFFLILISAVTCLRKLFYLKP